MTEAKPAALLIDRTDLFGRVSTMGMKIDRDVLANALSQQLKDLPLSDLVASMTNRLDAILEYMWLLEGKKTGNTISLLFNPHRLTTKSRKSKCSIYDSLKQDKYASALARVILYRANPSSKQPIKQIVCSGWDDVIYIHEIPPHAIRDLFIRYRLSRYSIVLDPCAGWGGGMLGASAVVNHYDCFEPSTQTYTGLKKIKAFIRSFRPEFFARVRCLPFEDAELEAGRYDLAFTSPPYYNTEEYSKESTNSLNRYSTFEKWVAGFFDPLVNKTMAALKPGAPFILNIGSRTYPLADTLRSRFKSLKIRRVDGDLNAVGLGKSGEGETFYELRTR